MVIKINAVSPGPPVGPLFARSPSPPVTHAKLNARSVRLRAKFKVLILVNKWKYSYK